MKKTFLLKTMLLLCALIAGTSSSWAIDVTISYTDIPDGFVQTNGTSGTFNKTVVTANDLTIAYSGINTKSSATAADHAYGYAMFLNSKGYMYSSTAPTGYYPSKVTVTFGSNTGTSGKAGISFGTSVLNTRNSSVTGSVTKSGKCELTNNDQTKLHWNFSTTGANVQVDNIVVVYSAINTSKVTTPSISPNGGEFVGSQEITLSCSTSGATIYYTLDGATPTTSSTQYETPFTITETKTVKAIAVKSGLTNSDVATATFTKVTPFANIATLTANTEAGTYFVTLTNAVVTYVNGNNAYIQDASGAVQYYKSGHGLTAGDVLNGTANVTFQFYNNNPQITALSGITPTSGDAPNPTSVTQAAWSYTFNNVLSQYFQITKATITTNNNKYYVSLNGEDVQIYKQGGGLSIPDLAKKYTITGFPTLNNTTKEIVVYANPTEEASADPAIAATPASLTGFTYVAGSGPSAAQTFSVSGVNLTEDMTLTASANYEISKTEGSGYANSLTISPTDGAVAVTTIYVRLKAGLAVNASYEGTVTLTSTGAANNAVSLAGSVTTTTFTWDLSIDETATATEDEMTWTGAFASMGVEKGSSTTNTNNYYPGTSGQTYTSTRFYKNSVLTITPVPGCTIESVVFTATTAGYATALGNSTWTNATAVAKTDAAPYTVTVTPTNGTSAISAKIGATCGFTAVMVYYENTGGAAVKISAATWASFSSNKALNFTGTGVTAYIAKYKDANNVTLTPIEKVPANTGIVVNAAAGSYDIPMLSGDADATTGNLLKPWLTAGEPTETGAYYTLAVDGEKKPVFKRSTGGILAAGKSYLVVPAIAAPSLGVDFGEGTTGIGEVRSQMEEVREGIFDLSGRRVENPTKGIYIVNGKKVIIK